MTPFWNDQPQMRYFLSTFRLTAGGSLSTEMIEADDESTAIAAGRAAQEACAGAVIYREAEDSLGVRHVVAVRAFGLVPEGVLGQP